METDYLQELEQLRQYKQEHEKIYGVTISHNDKSKTDIVRCNKCHKIVYEDSCHVDRCYYGYCVYCGAKLK